MFTMSKPAAPLFDQPVFAELDLINPERWARKRLEEVGIKPLQGNRTILRGEAKGKTTTRGWFTPGEGAEDSVYWGKTIKEAFENARKGKGVPLTETLKPSF